MIETHRQLGSPSSTDQSFSKSSLTPRGRAPRSIRVIAQLPTRKAALAETSTRTSRASARVGLGPAHRGRHPEDRLLPSVRRCGWLGGRREEKAKAASRSSKRGTPAEIVRDRVQRTAGAGATTPRLEPGSSPSRVLRFATSVVSNVHPSLPPLAWNYHHSALQDDGCARQRRLCAHMRMA